MKTFILTIGLAIFFTSPALALYSGGSGTSNDPWQISCPNDLLYLGSHTEHYGSCFILTSDINLTDYTFTAAVISSDVNNSNWDFDGSAFNGTFDGKGFVIRNLTIDTNGVGNDYLGLFGKTHPGSDIKNFRIEDVNITGGFGSDSNVHSAYIGGLVGWNQKGRIFNNYLTGSVAGSACIGVLVGLNYGGTITNCYSKGFTLGDSWLGGLIGNNHGMVINCHTISEITGISFVPGFIPEFLGGLIGANSEGGTIKNCSATGSVNCAFCSYSLGGLVGYNDDLISNCYAIVDVVGESSSYNIGGLVGYNYEGTVVSCYSQGDVTGYIYVGGLVGNNESQIMNCYSTSTLTYNDPYMIGSLVGYNYFGLISNCFWNTQTSGILAGVGGNSHGTITNLFGKNNTEMQTQSTFTGLPTYWDFVGETDNGTEDIWRMCADGVEYPRLGWEFINGRGDFVCPDGVNFADYLVLANAWLSAPADTNWDAKSDLYQDSRIDNLDLKILMENWLVE